MTKRSASQIGMDFANKAMNRGHRLVLKATGDRVLSSAFGMPAVELHTRGRKSGEPRSCMLTAPIHDENRVVLVASKGGDDRNPAWYLNLVADPEVELVIEGRRRLMRARTASAAERAELWPQVVRAYKGYGGYQKRTSREIPLVICEPRLA